MPVRSDDLVKTLGSIFKIKDRDFIISCLTIVGTDGTVIPISKFEKDKTFRQYLQYNKRMGNSFNNNIEMIAGLIKQYFSHHIFLPKIKSFDLKNKTITYYSLEFDYDGTLPIECLRSQELADKLVAFYTKFNEERSKCPTEAIFRKKLTRTITTTIGRFARDVILKYHPDEQNHLDHVIKNISDAFKPVQLYVAEKPEDYVQMYSKNGPSSCMTADEKAVENTDIRTPWPILTKLGLTATSLYGLMPDLFRGYYMKGMDGKVTARTVCFNNRGKWEYISLYSNGPVDKQKFTDALHAEGVYRLNGTRDDNDKANDNARGVTCYTIPPRTYKIDIDRFRLPEDKEAGNIKFYIPSPYLDYSHEPYDMKFYTLNGEYYMAINDKVPSDATILPSSITHTHTTMVSDTLPPRCVVCDREARHVSYKVNKPFCCDEHAIKWAARNGYCIYYISPDDRYLVQTADIMHLRYMGNEIPEYYASYNGVRVFYVSVNLAEQLGGKRFRYTEDNAIMIANYDVPDKICDLTSNMARVKLMELKERNYYDAIAQQI